MLSSKTAALFMNYFYTAYTTSVFILISMISDVLCLNSTVN